MSGPLIKIFSQLYVGFNKRRHREDDGTWKDFKLAFVTPYEDNQAGRKRQATVDSWAETSGDYTWEVDPETGRREQKFKPLPDDYKTVTIDNVPMEGFRLTEDIRRTYWGGGNVVWRIESPLGWEFEISSSCLARLITDVGFEPGGTIPGKCIFGRCGAENILIPEASDLYQQSIKDAETMNARSKSVSSNSVVPGSICLMKNGDTMVYLGQFYMTALQHIDNARSRPSYYGKTFDTISEDAREISHYKSGESERFHLFRRPNPNTTEQVEPDNYAYMYKDKRVVSVSGVDKHFEDLTRNQEFLNESGVRCSYAASGRYVYYDVAMVYTIEKPISTEVVALPIDNETLKADFDFSAWSGNYDHFNFIRKLSRRKYLVVDEAGHSLSSMTLAGTVLPDPNIGKDEIHRLQFARDSIKVFFAKKFTIDQNGLLSVGDLSVRTYDCMFNLGRFKYVRRHDHFEAKEIISQAFNEALAKFKYRVLKFAVTTKSGVVQKDIDQ